MVIWRSHARVPLLLTISPLSFRPQSDILSSSFLFLAMILRKKRRSCWSESFLASRLETSRFSTPLKARSSLSNGKFRNFLSLPCVVFSFALCKFSFASALFILLRGESFSLLLSSFLFKSCGKFTRKRTRKCETKNSTRKFCSSTIASLEFFHRRRLRTIRLHNKHSS